MFSLADYSSCHPCTDASPTYPRGCRSHIVLQVQAVLQGNAWKIHLYRYGCFKCRGEEQGRQYITLARASAFVIKSCAVSHYFGWGCHWRHQSEVGVRTGWKHTRVGFLFACLSLQWDISLPRVGEEGRETDTPVLKQRKSASTRSHTHRPALRRILLNISISCCPASVARVQSLFASPSHHNSFVSGIQGAEGALSPASAADSAACSVLWGGLPHWRPLSWVIWPQELLTKKLTLRHCRCCQCQTTLSSYKNGLGNKSSSSLTFKKDLCCWFLWRCVLQELTAWPWFWCAFNALVLHIYRQHYAGTVCLNRGSAQPSATHFLIPDCPWNFRIHHKNLWLRHSEFHWAHTLLQSSVYT